MPSVFHDLPGSSGYAIHGYADPGTCEGFEKDGYLVINGGLAPSETGFYTRGLVVLQATLIRL